VLLRKRRPTPATLAKLYRAVSQLEREASEEAVREDLPEHDDYRFIAEYEGEKIRSPSVTEAAPDAMYLQEHRKLTGFD
jgi:hypothetical protein